MKRREAVAAGAETYKTGKPCKKGHVAERRTKDGVCVRCWALRPKEARERRHANLEGERAKQRARYHADLEKSRTYNRMKAQERRDADPEAARQYVREWRRKNTRRCNAHSALKRARQLNAAPSWLTTEQKEEMVAFYIACPKGWHVDHVLPLDAPGICGLHVPWNLQYLPGTANHIKRNRLDPLKWPEQSQLGYPPKLTKIQINQMNRKFRIPA